MTTLKRKATRISMLLILVMLVLAIGIVLKFAMKWGTLDMKQNAFAADTESQKPLIDTQDPKQVATATFAMG